MSFDRRKFIRRIGEAAGTLALSTLVHPATAATFGAEIDRVAHLSPELCAKEEDFWQQIRLAYTSSSTILDMNNGGVSPQPRVVQDAFFDYTRMCNKLPSYYMWRHLDRGKNIIREKLAKLGGCQSDEVAITRNASEALETIIFGLRLQAGDEVIISKQAYPNVVNAWKQRAFREGIVVKWLDFKLPQENDKYFLRQYEAAISPKTKIIHATHVINWNGQILPVKKITELAHQRGIEVVIDGAHSFAQLEFKISDIGCDYFGTSLHKWLCAPFGTGMLYVKKEKIKNLYPLFASADPEEDQIQKFENMGTHPSAAEQAIVQAIDFHNLIGTARKEERLRYLKNYWVKKAARIPGFKLHSPMNKAHGCGIATFEIEGKNSRRIGSKLYTPHRIHTVTIDWEGISGLRISPNVYTLPSDLDRFVDALEQVVNAYE